jgi:hypothetical protein
MSESSLTWTFDPPEADKCLLASGEFDVHLFPPLAFRALQKFSCAFSQNSIGNCLKFLSSRRLAERDVTKI